MPLKHQIFNERPESQDRLIKMLVKMGFEYVSRSEAERKRGKLNNVLFIDELTEFLNKQKYNYKGIDFSFSGESISRAVREINVSLIHGLLPASKEIFTNLTLGISVTESISIDSDIYDQQSFDLNYIDFKEPKNNIWQVTEEFSVERTNGEHSRPDIVILLNGIPIVIIECKSSSINVDEGVNQNVRNMQPQYIPQLFKFSQLVIAAEPNRVKYGTTGTEAGYFVEWKEDKESLENSKEKILKYIDDGQVLEQDKAIYFLLNKERLLNLIKNYIIYDNGIKKIARYQQFFAIEKSIKRFKGFDGEELSDGGVIWHTQGSGKSLTMVMLVKKIMLEFSAQNPRFIIVTDRINLDKQIKDNFANTQLNPIRATTGRGLIGALKDSSNIVVTTVINKFETAIKNNYFEKNSETFYILIDEAHRSNYGSMFNYMKEVMPNAKMIAFTGTPLISKSKYDKDTIKRFGKLIHSYTMKKSIDDGITVPLVYEGKIVKQDNPKEIINQFFEEQTRGLNEDQKEDLKKKYSKFQTLAKIESRLSLIAFDIVNHFKIYLKPKGIKAILACSSRAVAVQMYNYINTYSNGLIKPAVCISFTMQEVSDGNPDDSSTPEQQRIIAEYRKRVVEPFFGNNDEKYDESITERFKNPEDELNLLIVKDKLLTGFDAPIAGVLYLDKSVREHGLLQTIARVNRVYSNKDFGLIVDYWGNFDKLNEAIELYDDAEYKLNNFDRSDFTDSILSLDSGKIELDKTHKNLLDFFEEIPQSKRESSNEWQLFLKEQEKRTRFYELLSEFKRNFEFSVVNYQLFKIIGLEKIEEYKKDLLFFSKLMKSVINRYESDNLEFKFSEDSLMNILKNFVNVDGIYQTSSPVVITNEIEMEKLIDEYDTNDAKADVIKTKAESKLKQIRYDDPLLFEEFSTKIKKTLAEYEAQRDGEKYLSDMKRIADDLKTGLTSKSYPNTIKDDQEAKAFYGSIANIIKNDFERELTLEEEEIIANCSIEIKGVIEETTKRDWKYNVIVHKELQRKLDNPLFNMFEVLSFDTNSEKAIEMIDLCIDSILKYAVSRY